MGGCAEGALLVTSWSFRMQCPFRFASRRTGGADAVWTCTDPSSAAPVNGATADQHPACLHLSTHMALTHLLQLPRVVPWCGEEGVHLRGRDGLGAGRQGLSKHVGHLGGAPQQHLQRGQPDAVRNSGALGRVRCLFKGPFLYVSLSAPSPPPTVPCACPLVRRPLCVPRVPRGRPGSRSRAHGQAPTACARLQSKEIG